ncbi:MAG: toll/interleukin-1 receptor domain-containing protein [Planctomycetota bacterium]
MSVIDPHRRYRVFVSYSHQNQQLVLGIRDLLQANGLQPMLDRDFAFGIGFHDQIRYFIEHAHVFLPIVTRESSQRGWVHQEIGYAISQNLPVLPISVGIPPGEWLQHLHAVHLPEEDLNEISDAGWQRLKAALTVQTIESLVGRYRNPAGAIFHCAELQEDRTQKMVEYATIVSMIQQSVTRSLQTGAEAGGNSEFDILRTSFVRQRGGLSSFHIPNAPLTDSVWQERYTPRRTSRHHCRIQREERRALEIHARAGGCRLIVNTDSRRDGLDDQAHKVRLQSLLKFLESDIESVEVVIDEKLEREYSLTLVGDWFCAEAVSAQTGVGYQQTIFTRHAPSMQYRISQFDEEFAALCAHRGWRREKSRQEAIEHLRAKLRLKRR